METGIDVKVDSEKAIEAAYLDIVKDKAESVLTVLRDLAEYCKMFREVESEKSYEYNGRRNVINYLLNRLYPVGPISEVLKIKEELVKHEKRLYNTRYNLDQY